MLIYDKSGRELRHRILLPFLVVEILTTQESVAKLNLQMVRYILTSAWQKIKMLSSSGQIFCQLHSVFEILLRNVDFWKADEKTISVIYRFAYFFLLFLLCVQSSKSCREGSILTEPSSPPPPPPPFETSLIENAPYQSYRKYKKCYNCKTNSRQKDESHSLLALIIKCSLCWCTHGIVQCVIGFCSGVPKGQLLQNDSEYGQLSLTAKQQLPILIPFILKTNINR